MPLVQTQHMYCTPAERREKILRARTAQKQLYGDIIRNGSYNKAKDDANNIEKPANSKQSLNEMKVSANDRSSEFYWLVKRGKSLRSAVKISTINKSGDKDKTVTEKLSKKSRSSETETVNSSNQDESNASTPDPTHKQPASQTSSTINARNAINSAKKIFQSFVANGHTSEKTHASAAAQVIPFNMDELSLIVKYPLVSGKCSLNETVSLTDKSVKIPSISKILTATMPEGARIALKKWKMAKIAELGPDGFKQYEKETLNLGKDFHSAIEQFLNNGQVPEPDSTVNQLWQSVNPSLNELKPKAVLLEQPILHADLKYKGIIDNVSMVG